MTGETMLLLLRAYWLYNLLSAPVRKRKTTTLDGFVDHPLNKDQKARTEIKLLRGDFYFHQFLNETLGKGVLRRDNIVVTVHRHTWYKGFADGSFTSPRLIILTPTIPIFYLTGRSRPLLVSAHLLD
ncbi:hypothetical protein DFH29DRAFT_1065900 [Suillus ampliporus]|nr:hypothetical protein DFH29DRAFT_1065900 [Suillus ampliporus]